MDSRRPPCATVFLILTVLEPSTASARADQPIAALAPVETVLDGRDELIGVAVTADGTLYVSDRGAGIVYRLPPSGGLGRAASGLDRPAGRPPPAGSRRLEGLVRVDGSLVAATRGLEIEPDSAGTILKFPILSAGALGAPATLVDVGLEQPIGLSVDALAAIYISTKRLTVETELA